MLVAVTSTGPERTSKIDEDFASARYVLFVDLASGSLEALDNMNRMDAGPLAGVRMAREILDRHPEWVLTGSIGSKAFRVFFEAGIKVGTGASDTVRDTLKRFDLGEFDLQEETEPIRRWEGIGEESGSLSYGEKRDGSEEAENDAMIFQTGDPTFPAYRPQIPSKRSSRH